VWCFLQSPIANGTGRASGTLFQQNVNTAANEAALHPRAKALRDSQSVTPKSHESMQSRETILAV
jgi:hypothetical protein